MSPDHPTNPPIGKTKNQESFSIHTKISTNINFWILIFILIYIVGLTMYTWIGKNNDKWDLFYFFNENYLKVIIPFLIARILTIKFLKSIFYGLAGFQAISFSFSLLKLLNICSNILLYKILTLTGVLILMGMIYVSIRKLCKE